MVRPLEKLVFEKQIITVKLGSNVKLVLLDRHEPLEEWPRVPAYASELLNLPADDVIYFSGMAKLNQLTLHVDNTLWAGLFPNPVQSGILQNEVFKFFWN